MKERRKTKGNKKNHQVNKCRHFAAQKRERKKHALFYFVSIYRSLTVLTMPIRTNYRLPTKSSSEDDSALNNRQTYVISSEFSREIKRFRFPDGYTCKCKPEYHDQNPAEPGRQCKFIENECLLPTLNDCDKHAKCIDTIDGYRLDFIILQSMMIMQMKIN